MSHGDPVFRHEKLALLREPEQAQQVGNGGSVFACTLADLFVIQVEIPAEALKGLGDFYGVQVFTLNILDKSDFQNPVIGKFPDDNRYFLELRDPCSTPPPLTGYQHIAVFDLLDHNRLDYA